MELDTVKNAKYIQFGLMGKWEDIWAVTERSSIKDEDGRVLFVRMTIDRNLGKLGDEQIVEWQQEAPRELSILTVFSTFPKAEAESWPPPRSISVEYKGENTEFISLNRQTGHHDPFAGFINGRLISHWEYQNGEGDKFLQVYEDEGIVYMSTGYVLNEAMVRIT